MIFDMDICERFDLLDIARFSPSKPLEQTETSTRVAMEGII
jgi:hypothetical protein